MLFNVTNDLNDAKISNNYFTTTTIDNIIKTNKLNKNERVYNATHIDVTKLYPKFICEPYCKSDVDFITNLYNIVDNNIESFKITGKEQNVVIVKFKDGDTQKAVCMPGDEFNLEIALTICIAKHSCKGSSNLYKHIKQAINNHYQEEYNKTLKEKEIHDNKIKEIKKAKKHKEYLADKRRRESEQRIEEMKIAILRAKQIQEGDNK